MSSKADTFDKLFGDDFFNAFKGGAGPTAAEAARLVRENQDLKKRLTASEEVVTTLRASKKFYQDNYGKAKAAYEKEVALRKAREAQDVAEAAALVELATRYAAELHRHEMRDDPGFIFPTFDEWRKN